MALPNKAFWFDVRSLKKSEKLPLIDLRSEGEFAKGSIPGALNVPLLDNSQRHEIGTVYKKEGKNAAVSLGLQMFSTKAYDFLERIWRLSTSSDSLIIYCWRGGMRSQLVQEWLKGAGINASLLIGGYKEYRSFVLEEMELLSRSSFLVLNGFTGSGKTQLIQDLQEEGYPAIDLEGLARHRGSAFGGFGQETAPPTQQNFENALIENFQDYRESSSILIELENNIGPINLSKSLRKALTQAPMIYVEREFQERVKLLSDLYISNWSSEDDEKFFVNLEMLRKYLPSTVYESCKIDLKKRNFSKVIGNLLTYRYDCAYEKSLKRHKSQVLANFNLSKEEKSAKDFIKKKLGEPKIH